MKTSKIFACAIAATLLLTSLATAAEPKKHTVAFREDSIYVVDGKPFLPIGIWLYELNTNVKADIHEHWFNTVIGNGFTPDKLDYIHQHGLMALPMLTSRCRMKCAA